VPEEPVGGARRDAVAEPAVPAGGEGAKGRGLAVGREGRAQHAAHLGEGVAPRSGLGHPERERDAPGRDGEVARPRAKAGVEVGAEAVEAPGGGAQIVHR
jgi:hypothetical protein